jgi:uncharacterized protein
MQRTRSDQRGRPARVWTFFALTFAWSWTCWLLSVAISRLSPWLATLLMFMGSFGPTLAAIVVVAQACGRARLRAWLLRCLRGGVGWGWWAFALIFPLVVMTVAACLHVALGGTMPIAPASGHLLMTAVNFFAIAVLGGPLGEEFGWRGYAQPMLQSRMGWRRASLLLGVVWGAWHLPLFFIAGTSQANIPLALFLLSVVAMSVLFAWLMQHTNGHVGVALLLHTAINFWPVVVPVLPHEGGYRAYALVVAMLVLAALLMLAPHSDAGVRAHVPT